MKQLSRRSVVRFLGILPMAAVAPRLSWAAHHLQASLEATDLIYLTPIKSNGQESRCQAEVWFVNEGEDMYVCTDTTSWRAYAPRLGLDKARVWIGDVGVWRSSNGAYRDLPSINTSVDIVKDTEQLDQLLNLFGQKYSSAWISWGPRFRSGLKDGSRTMLRYRPA